MGVAWCRWMRWLEQEYVYRMLTKLEEKESRGRVIQADKVDSRLVGSSGLRSKVAIRMRRFATHSVRGGEQTPRSMLEGQ